MFHTIEEAITDLKKGKPIIVVDDENRENEGDFVALSEKVTPEMINFMITHGKGLVCTTITEQLLEKLNFPMMTNQNTDPLGTAFTVSIDHKDTETGISAFERYQTIRALLDPETQGSDFKQPGHVFPLVAKAGGVLTRPGHTEASIDLAKLSGAFPSGVICEIIRDDGRMARVPDLMDMAQQFNLKLISIEDLIRYRKQQEVLITREVETVLPTSFGSFKIIGYSNELDDKEHVALVKGNVRTNDPVLTRIHSECLTGDVFGSKRCDCGPQLHRALEQIEEAKAGVFIYMRQEGRGIGLLNKLRAYKLQDQGLDTCEANEKLGFAPDCREYTIAAQILRELGVNNIKLLTNNPEKVTALQSHGLHVEERLPLVTPLHEENEQYIRTKREKFGHVFKIHS
ncbi:MAG TPA: bifunctional 3,4-dihydroxy-2-butanone-4-phosphate synthase/GTP cyclohydrolase II [Bacillota bacterium]